MKLWTHKEDRLRDSELNLWFQKRYLQHFREGKKCCHHNFICHTTPDSILATKSSVLSAVWRSKTRNWEPSPKVTDNKEHQDLFDLKDTVKKQNMATQFFGQGRMTRLSPLANIWADDLFSYGHNLILETNKTKTNSNPECKIIGSPL